MSGGPSIAKAKLVSQNKELTGELLNRKNTIARLQYDLNIANRDKNEALNLMNEMLWMRNEEKRRSDSYKTYREFLIRNKINIKLDPNEISKS